MHKRNSLVIFSASSFLRAAILLMLAIAAIHSPALAQTSELGRRTQGIPVLAFQGVTVIDVIDGRLMGEQTVVITGNRIDAVGPMQKVRPPVGARVIDARGQYLIPGLWDMHTHLDRTGWADTSVSRAVRNNARRFLASGVTGVRDMAQRFEGGVDSFRVWQRAIAAGTMVGPRLSGLAVDLTDGIQASRHLKIKTEDRAREVIDSLKAVGIDFLKYHDSKGDPQLFFAILRQARRAGLPIVGHVPEAVEGVQAADSGMLSVEHAEKNRTCSVKGQESFGDSTTAAARCRSVVEAYIRNGTWATPTFGFLYYGILHGVLYAEDRGQVNPRKESPRPDPNIGRLKQARQVIGTMYEVGFRNFLAGTDAPANSPPGLSLLNEIVLMAGVGLTPLEALQSATLGPAKFLKATDSLGTVAPGKLADLVFLGANPLADIKNIWKVQAVVANGRYFDRTALDALDPEGVNRAAQWERVAQAAAAQLPNEGKVPR